MEIDIPQTGGAPSIVQSEAPAVTKMAATATTLTPRRFRSKDLLAGVLTHGALIIAALIAIVPLLLIFFTSLKTETETFSTTISILPKVWRWDNYSYVLHDNFLTYLRNSIYVALLTMAIALCITLPAGYALSRFEFLGKQGVLLSFLVTQMFPAPLLLVPLYLLYVNFHLLNNVNGLVIAYATTALPFSVWMLKNFFDSIPKELDQAGLVDGLNVWGVFYRIVAPLTVPGIAVVAFYNFMNSWNEFMFANLFISSTDQQTLPISLHNYDFATGVHWPWLCADAILITLPVMFFFFWAQRYLIAGLTGGSVKG